MGDVVLMSVLSKRQLVSVLFFYASDWDLISLPLDVGELAVIS